MANTHTEHARLHPHDDVRSFSLIFALGFAVFLVIALMGTAMGLHLCGESGVFTTPFGPWSFKASFCLDWQR